MQQGRRSENGSARHAGLNAKKAKREKVQQEKLDDWCTEHDKDGNGEFDRAELKSLLIALHPEHTIEETTLDQLMERATGVYTASMTLRGDKNGSVTKRDMLKTVSQYECCEPSPEPRRSTLRQHACTSHGSTLLTLPVHPTVPQTSKTRSGSTTSSTNSTLTSPPRGVEKTQATAAPPEGEPARR